MVTWQELLDYIGFDLEKYYSFISYFFALFVKEVIQEGKKQSNNLKISSFYQRCYIYVNCREWNAGIYKGKFIV